MSQLGICFLDRPDGREQVRLAQRADREGWDSVWVCETRTARDAISVLGAMAATTERVKLGPGVVNSWTRGPVLMALTFASLDEMAPDRMILGIGAYWDPLAWKQGIERVKPVRQMREYIEVVRRLLAMEDVDYEGEVVKVRDIRLELGKGADRRPKHVPIYVGATGLQMVSLTGQIADGILLNAFTSVGYQAKALERLEEGARRTGRSLDEIDKPQLVSVFLSEDGESARYEARYMATMYLGQQPHIAKASGIEQTLIDDVNRAMGGWPPQPEGIDKAMALVPDEVVDELCAAGTAEQCRERVRRYVNDGVHPIVMPLTANYDEVMDAFQPSAWSAAQ